MVPVLDKTVFDKYHYSGINEKITNFSTALVKLGLQKIYPDTIAHALYYAIKHKFLIRVNEEKLIEILSLKDCITNVLLLEYATRNNLKKVIKELKQVTTKLKKAGPRDIDRNWLLVYQTWNEEELNGKGQSFLALLKKENFKFLNIRDFDLKKDL